MAQESQYSNMVKMHNIVQDQIKDLREKSDNIKEDIAKLMHEDQINEKITEVDGIKFKICYQGRTNKSVDHNALIELVGPNKYNDIVKQSHSEFLSIRKAPKGQQTSLVHTAPNGSKKDLVPPTGTLA